MKSIIRISALAVGLLCLGAVAALAQGQNGRGDGKQAVGVSYYKLPPGRQDEWLALYKKYHFPIMKYEIEHGQVISEKIFASGSHSIQPSWDIAIVIVGPAPGAKKAPEKTRAEIIRSLFPDLADYVKGEKQRWALTLEHWDEKLVELDLDNGPLSLYEPIDAPARK